jgi:hypothetical protein
MGRCRGGEGGQACTGAGRGNILNSVTIFFFWGGGGHTV